MKSVADLKEGLRKKKAFRIGLNQFNKVNDINIHEKMLGVKCGKLDQFLHMEIENDMIDKRIEERAKIQSTINQKFGLNEP